MFVTCQKNTMRKLCTISFETNDFNNLPCTSRNNGMGTGISRGCVVADLLFLKASLSKISNSQTNIATLTELD